MKLTAIVSALFLSAVLIVTARAHGGHKLDDAQCAAVWAKVSPNGDAIPSSQAEAYVTSYILVDSDQDGMISAEEFKYGCANGLVIHPDEATTKEGGK
jgi:hypothetical protein